MCVYVLLTCGVSANVHVVYVLLTCGVSANVHVV